MDNALENFMKLNKENRAYILEIMKEMRDKNA
jgi:hypothetical protein